MRIYCFCSLTVLICLSSISTGCQTEEQKARNEILALFHQYKLALNTPDAADRIYPLLSRMYLNDFEINIDFALHAHEKKVRFLPMQQKAMVLSMRHKVPVEVLASGDTKAVLESLLKDAITFIPEDTPLSDLQFNAETSARGIYHTSLYSKSIMFYKNKKTSMWQIDPRGDSGLQKAEMQKLIEENKAKGVTEEDMLRTVILGLSASADSVLRWDPLVPAGD